MASFPNLVAHYDEEEQKEQLLTHHLIVIKMRCIPDYSSKGGETYAISSRAITK